jgi:hypothetical protein
MTDSPSDRNEPSDQNPTQRYEPQPPMAPPPRPGELPAEPSAPAEPAAPPQVQPPPEWHRTRDRGPFWGPVIAGVVLLAIGLWFFANVTLDLEMPTLRWSDLWPLILIGIGGWIVLASTRRPSR